ncbi:hypothetical protein PIB30_083822 [Stylosanthes scabra]|uniref:Uncharacterized protein n=1 Tax=Stylosanthes scabra TaxID=79078 RepID=A0ABU6ST33_9FABA|nr:hypothetical protein [Stylosanthes scabra]
MLVFPSNSQVAFQLFDHGVDRLDSSGYCDFFVTWDVLGALSVLTLNYLDELKLSEVIFGGGELERRYRVEAPRPGDRVCYLNLDHHTVPNWLWVNEVIFTDFAVQVPFTDFQQRLLRRAAVAPSQLHPNAWSAIQFFELVTEFLELPQDPEVFFISFNVLFPNIEGKTKKGYMSVRPSKNWKILALMRILSISGAVFSRFSRLGITVPSG